MLHIGKLNINNNIEIYSYIGMVCVHHRIGYHERNLNNLTKLEIAEYLVAWIRFDSVYWSILLCFSSWIRVITPQQYNGNVCAAEHGHAPNHIACLQKLNSRPMQLLLPFHIAIHERFEIYTDGDLPPIVPEPTRVQTSFLSSSSWVKIRIPIFPEVS